MFVYVYTWFEGIYVLLFLVIRQKESFRANVERKESGKGKAQHTGIKNWFENKTIKCLVGKSDYVVLVGRVSPAQLMTAGEIDNIIWPTENRWA